MKPLSETAGWHTRLHDQAVEIPGPTVDALAAAAKEGGVYAVVGTTEREPGSVGTLYNTNVVVSSDGELLGKHRKLVPTWGERVVWAGGDGSTLSVFPTRFGPLGTLNCGENISIRKAVPRHRRTLQPVRRASARDRPDRADHAQGAVAAALDPPSEAWKARTPNPIHSGCAQSG